MKGMKLMKKGFSDFAILLIIAMGELGNDVRFHFFNLHALHGKPEFGKSE